MLKVGAEIPPEILNNVGALQFRQGHLEESKKCFEKAMDRTKEEGSEDDTYYSQIAISIRLFTHKRISSIYWDIIGPKISICRDWLEEKGRRGRKMEWGWFYAIKYRRARTTQLITRPALLSAANNNWHTTRLPILFQVQLGSSEWGIVSTWQGWTTLQGHPNGVSQLHWLLPSTRLYAQRPWTDLRGQWQIQRCPSGLFWSLIISKLYNDILTLPWNLSTFKTKNWLQFKRKLLTINFGFIQRFWSNLTVTNSVIVTSPTLCEIADVKNKRL